MAIKIPKKPEFPKANATGKDVRNGKAKKTNVKGGKAKTLKSVHVKRLGK